MTLIRLGFKGQNPTTPRLHEDKFFTHPYIPSQEGTSQIPLLRDVGWALPTKREQFIPAYRLFSTGNRNIVNTNGTRGIFYWWAMPTLLLFQCSANFSSLTSDAN